MTTGSAMDGKPWNRVEGVDAENNTTLPDDDRICEWRLGHQFLAGLNVVFQARMRMRGGCGENFLSPPFDHWNGARAIIPPTTEWREVSDPVDPKGNTYAALGYEGADPESCPFCGRTPTFEAHETGGGRGIVILGRPDRFDRWNLRCCGWAARPSYRDPRELVANRRDAFARHRNAR